MLEFCLETKINYFEYWKDFCDKFLISKDDLVITNKFFVEKYDLKSFGCTIIFQEEYGTGEPNDDMIDSISKEIKDLDFKRIIGIGGGTVLDISKLFALKTFYPIEDLFTKKINAVKNIPLILIPTTCGTGSEVTNISIIKLNSLHTKLGLSDNSLYADYSVLIPELIENLPQYVFATSSIDALIHAVESYLSPKATDTVQMFSEKAIENILKGYLKISKGEKIDAKKFLYASCYAGIAFGIAGCAAVHALSYPIGANYGVAHGESNYSVFFAVMKKYQELNPNGKIGNLKSYISKIIECEENIVFDKLSIILGDMLAHKKLSSYGIKKSELSDFSVSVLENQVRLLDNNYIQLSQKDILDIYQSTY